MNKEVVEVNALKEYVNEAFGDPILTLAINSALKKNIQKINIVSCGKCELGDDKGCSKRKVWCNLMCRYMDEDAFCSEGK